MPVEHRFPKGLDSRNPFRVLIVGAGGTGSAILMGLPYLDQAMKVWGYPNGLEVTLMDADVVSPTNCVRQPFALSDVGLNKARVLVNRINLFWGTKWRAEPANFDDKTLRHNVDLRPNMVIACVDTRAARQMIHNSLSAASDRTQYWLDLGNNASSGQYVLGQPLNAFNRRKADRLRTVAELYPEIVDTSAGEDPQPSCSAAEALEKQEPFINQALAASALAMLARLFRYRTLNHHGAFYNAATGRMSALPIDPALWKKARRISRKYRVASSKRLS